MGLQKGNVEVNGTLGQPPEPLITVEEFREQFTERHREALRRSIASDYYDLRNSLLAGGFSEEEAKKEASEMTRASREALQLVFKLHPPPYEW